MSNYEKGIEEPWVAWDRYCERKESAYQALIDDTTCERCANCVVPDDSFDNLERIGYCKDCGEFIRIDDSPKIMECEAYE